MELMHEPSIEVLRQQMKGRAQFLRDRGEVKTPQLLEIASEFITPPAAQRQWVELTGDEIVNMLPDDDTPMSLGEAFFKFAELVEAKLKEKNT